MVQIHHFICVQWVATGGANTNVQGYHNGVQCDQISEATGVQRVAAGGVNEVQGDHVAVLCVQGELQGDQGQNGVQSSHFNEVDSTCGQGHKIELMNIFLPSI